MEWSIGHSLIVVVAVLLGLAAGWLLRGRQGAGAAARPIVDGDPVAGLAVVTSPEPPAMTDEARPAASIDSPPAAVADEPAPVDTVSAPATVTTSDDSAPDAVDPGDMALTEAPPAVPADDRTAAFDEPGTVDEQPAPATVVAPRQPLDDRNDTPSDEPIDATPVDTTPAEPVDATPADATPAEPIDATPAETVPAAPDEQAEAVPAESAYTGTTPADTTPAVAAGLPAVDVDEAEPARATPPVRATDAPPIPAATADTDPTGPADTDPTGPADDFRRIQGVGPKMAAALQAAGVRTYRQLGELDEPALRDLIRTAGLRAAPALATWPQQARVLAGAGDAASAVLPGGDQG
ncbi:hypothetical protein [Micromonospora sp. NPDC049662]|uniref:hypothetical protein n=1 Tax=unclassified Micromonospora TaxID=2617518 RepID=UPI00342651B4